MKKKIFIGIVILVFTIAATLGVLALFPAHILGEEIFSQQIDMDEKLILNFEDNHIRLAFWDKDVVKVTESKLHQMVFDDNITITLTNNELNLESDGLTVSEYPYRGIVTFQSQIWLPLLKFERYLDYTTEALDQNNVDFFIYVPKGLEIDANCRGVVWKTYDRNMNYVDVKFSE